MDNVVKDFAESGDAGWKLTSPQVTQFVFTQLDEYDDVILVAKTAQDFFLVNREYTRVKVVIPETNGDFRSE